MRYTQRYWTRVITLVCILFSVAIAQDGPRVERAGIASTVEEAALRTLAGEFYAAYARKDMDGLLRLWSAKSPELASRRTVMQKFFAEHEKIELKGLAIRKVTIDGWKANLRVDVEMSAIENKTGKPAAGFGPMNRSLHCAMEEEKWKVWREESAAVDLAAILIATKTAQERATLLAEEKGLASVELRKALIGQGDQLRFQGRYPQALIIYQFAHDIAENIGDRQGIAASLNNAALAYRMQGDYGLAKNYFQRSLHIHQELGNKDGVARSLNNIGLVYALQSDHGPALEYFRKSLVLKQELGDKASIGSTLTSIGAIYYLQGDFVQAMEFYRKGLELSEAARDKAGMAQALNNIGITHQSQVDYSMALETYRKSLKLRQEIEDKPGIAAVLANMGTVYRLQGNYSLAMDCYHKSLKWVEELGIKEEMAATFSNIGIIHALQGNSELARFFYQKSLDIKEELKDRAGVSRTLGNFGALYRRQGNYDLAKEFYQKSLALAEALKNKEMIAINLGNLGNAHLSQGYYDLAMEHYQKSLPLSEELGIKDQIVRNLNGIGQSHRRKGNYAQGLESAERAITIARQTEDREQLFDLLTTMGQIYAALQQNARAHQSFEEAITVIESLRARVAGGDQEQQRFFEDKLTPYQGMVELLVVQNQSVAALAYAERAKARTLLDVLRSGRISVTKAMTAEEQEQERGFNNRLVSLNTQISRENIRPHPDAARLNDLKAQLQQARLDYEAFQTSLYAAHPELKTQRGEAEPLTLEQARGLLPDARCALLEYVVTDEKTYLFALTGNAAGTAIEVKVYPLEIKGHDLGDRVSKFREALAQGSPGFRQPARELYDLLLKPAAAQLQGKTSLVIVPDGTLWELPFQALLTAPNHYLIEDSAIAYAPSLTALREMTLLRDRKRDSTESSTLLAFGNPALGKQTIARARLVLMDEKLDPLPEAERQVNELRRIYGAAKSRVYTGAEAREERAKAEAGAYRILHLATHGVLNDVSPMYSRVLLSQTEGDANEDGLLEAWEIMKMDLKADLAVLSACETARGRVGAGEGMIGLSWALFVAGCPATVVSQWKVDSASTTELMIEFHRQLQSQGTNPPGSFSAARALREAALKLQRTAKYRHPFYWAGFIVSGKGF
jgi:CHAT domain-containing protein/Tfp pilus assembly protein PilF